MRIRGKNPITKVLEYFQRLGPKRTKFKNSRVHRLLGNTIFRRELWQFKPHLMAGGVAVGVFIAFTPTCGVQMIIAAALCVLLGVNLPLSAVSTWITNYISSPIIYYWCFRLGAYILNLDITWTKSTHDILSMPTRRLMEVIPALWVGGIIIGGIGALVSYWMVYGLAVLERKIRFSDYRLIRSQRKKPRVSGLHNPL